MTYEQISIKEPVDPFAGEPVRAGKKKANRFSGGLKPLAVGRLFSGLSALPVIYPYRAEQAAGFAGGYDWQRPKGWESSTHGFSVNALLKIMRRFSDRIQYVPLMDAQ